LSGNDDHEDCQQTNGPDGGDDPPPQRARHRFLPARILVQKVAADPPLVLCPPNAM
jgi:hypothetical protein